MKYAVTSFKKWSFGVAALAASLANLSANPTGGEVAGGSASINTIPGTVTVNQVSNTAVINWQSFSIGSGELTKFIQPSSSSAVLNRVLGGQTSIINGTLNANGQVYLLNGNGILIGAGGVVNTNGFTASTRDISDTDFMNGNLHFTGTGDAGVSNLGKVTAIGGDVIFIGKTVDNKGEINAPNGHVGLAAGDDVTITQSGMEHVFVRPTNGATDASGKTAVSNSGTIAAATAELKAANGNVYALAVNNTGIIRATGVSNQDGRIFLIAEGNKGTTQNTGTLVARAKGSTGGAIETSGGKVVAHGTVDAGTGTWLIDPVDINIDSTTAATIVTSLNGGGTVTEDSSTAGTDAGNITVSSAVVWTGTGTLNLNAYNNVLINAALTGTNGTLNIRSGYTNPSPGGTSITTGAGGTINVKNFNLTGGNWIQNLPAANLPSFAATNFSITSGATFLRAAGGSGTVSIPYQIVDVYGLQGIGSSATYEAANWRVSSPINASNTATWNSGAGFVPIANFTGTFNGNGQAISGLTINLPTSTNVGLFGVIGSAGVVNNLLLTSANITGKVKVGAIAGENDGLINFSSATGTISGTNTSGSTGVGGLTGSNTGTVSNSFANATVKGYNGVGGIVGSNTGYITSSYALGSVISFNNVSASGTNFGGLTGSNSSTGLITLSYSQASVSALDSSTVGGLIGSNSGTALQNYFKGGTVTGNSTVGGLVGQNTGTITIGQVLDGASTVVIKGTQYVGGFVGKNSGTISSSSMISSGTVTGQNGFAGAVQYIGGFVGDNTNIITSSFSLVTVNQGVGALASYVGGFAGGNESTGSMTAIYALGNVTGNLYVGGLVGSNAGALGQQSYATGTVTGSGTGNGYVGGLVGYNIGAGSIGAHSYATGNVTGDYYVGGLIGENSTTFTLVNVYSQQNTVTGTSTVGGLIGYNNAGNLTDVYASGLVVGTAAGNNLGGLVGYNATSSIITTSYATGNVSAATSTDVGGLVGYNNGSIVSGGMDGLHSYASGDVTGGSQVGGLVGYNTGTIGDSTATIVEDLPGYTTASGLVTGQTYVGGLVGQNGGTVQQSSATGDVNGASNTASAVGGLVGYNQSSGFITVTYATGDVSGTGTAILNGAHTDKQVGGLVGLNEGGIISSNASGIVYGDNQVGGLLGQNNASTALVEMSYSTGDVHGLTDVGGLVGQNTLGSVYQNYSSSNVTGGTGSVHVGGLVGDNQATVLADYAIGNVAGANLVGGLVGYNEATGTIDQTYASGAITYTGTAGGLVGSNVGTVSNSYWDEDSTLMGIVGIGNDPTNTGATGLTTTNTSLDPFKVASYGNFGTASSVPTGASNAYQINNGTGIIWNQLDGGTRPYLAWEAPVNGLTNSSGAYLIYTSHQLQLIAMNLSANYALAQDIDLAETSSASGLWNIAAGWSPIGDGLKPFTGSLDGGGYSVATLFINRPSTTYVGLFGANTGGIGGFTLSGSVTGLDQVGLLVGYNNGTVSDVSLNGTVAGHYYVGGLTGINDGTINDFAVNVATSGAENVGGLVGQNTGAISDGYSLGNVTATGNELGPIGGLVGSNNSTGTISVTYATGNVTGGLGTTGYVGGLVGHDFGSIDQSYATGDVTGSSFVGGLVGDVSGTGLVNQSYATGDVFGSNYVGGLAGGIGAFIGGTITRSYASGKANTGSSVGGLVGYVDGTGTYSNLYWDSANSSVAIGEDNSTGQGPIVNLHGLTINGSTSTYTGLDSDATPGFATGVNNSAIVWGSADSVWRIQTGWEYPLLTQLSTQVSGVAYSDPGHTTVAAGATVTLNSGANLLPGTTTADGSGNFAFLFAADDGLFNYLPLTNDTLRISDSAHNADSIAAKSYNSNGVPNLLGDVQQANTWGDTVRVVTGGLDNTLLATAGSSFITGTVNENKGTDLVISENFDVADIIQILDPMANYSINGNITAQGNVTFDSAGVVPDKYTHGVTLQAAATGGNPTPTFTLNAGLSSNALGRAIIVESDGSFINTVGTSAFTTSTDPAALGTWIVYSQNPDGSGQPVVDNPDGLQEYHLYGTDYMQTPAYLLSPDLNYQIYTFQPTLTLTAIATGADPTTNSLTVQYGTATPPLTYTVSGLLAGDTVTAGQTFNQVLSNQPGIGTSYAQYSGLGDYPVQFISSTLPTSLIGYKLVFADGNINVTQNTSNVTLTVSGSQYFSYQGGGPNFTYTATGIVSGDPNFNPTFATTVGQYTNVNFDGMGNVIPYANTITVTGGLGNYANITVVTDNGYTVKPAKITITANGTSIYGENIVTPTLVGNSTAGSGLVYDNSGSGGTISLTTAGYATGSTGLTSASHVGSTNFSVTGTSGTSSTGVMSNYDVTIDPGTYVITPRPLVINATQNETKVYDGDPNPITFGNTDYAIGATATGTGLVNGDTVSGLMGRVSNTDPNVGHYNYTQGTLSAGSDYTISYNNNGYGLNITARPITISTIQGTTKVYGSADPSITSGSYYTVSAGTLASGESLTPSGVPGRAPGEAVNGGVVYLYTTYGTIGVVNGGSASTTSNYAITFNNTAGVGLTITPAPLDITAKNQSKTYGNTFTFTGTQFTSTGLQFGETIGSTTMTSTGAVNTANVAGSAYTINVSGATGGTFNTANYTITYHTGLLTVNRAPLTVTAKNETKVYGDTYTFNGTEFTSSGLKNSETIGTVTLTSSGSVATASVAGSQYDINASSAVGGTFDINNYTVTYVKGKMTVTPAPLTITADNGSKIYGQTYTYTGTEFTHTALQNGETLSTVTMSSSGDIATAGVAGSPYNINVSGGVGTGFVASNYSITYVKGALTITPADITVAAIGGSSTYGQNPSNPGLSATGLQNGENANTVLTGLSNSFGITGTTNVNLTGYTLSVDGTLTNPNYHVTSTSTGNWIVNPALLTITANSDSKTYGQTYTFDGTEFTSSGLQNGETIGTTSLSSTGAVNTANVAGSPYDINISNAVGGTFNISNYTVTYVKGGLTVNPALLTITANSDTKVYGQTYTFDGTEFTSSGLQNGETIGTTSLSSTGAVNTASVAGSKYDINVSNAVGGTFDINNYTVTYVKGKLTVTPAALTVTADNGSKTYGQTYTYTGTEFTHTALQNGETLSTVTMSSSGDVATANVSGSPYDINVSGGSGTGFVASNYDITYVKGALTINAADITVTALGGTSVYGQSPTNPGLSATGLQNGQDVSVLTGLSNSFGITNTSNVNTYTLNVDGTLTNSNYNITTRNDGSWSVTPAALTVTANDGSKTYGQTYTYNGTEFTSSGLQNGETIGTTTMSSSGDVSTASVAGSKYDINISGATGGTFDINNYSVTYVKGKLTVGAADLTITANNGSKTYGQTYTYNGTEFTSSGLQNSETIGTATMSSSGDVATANVAGSPYDINISGATGGTFDINNYNVTYEKGALTINAANITVTALGGTSVYGESPTNPGLSATGLQNGQDVSVLTGLSNSFGITNTTNVNLTGYTLNVDGTLTNSNYNITQRNDGNWTVTPAALTVTADNGSKTYGQTYTYNGTEFTSSGLQNGETIGTTTMSSSGDVATANVAGSPYDINISGATGGTFSANNYDITYVKGALTINAADITVTANGGTSVYGQSPTNPGLSATGLQNGQDVSVLTGLSNSFGITNTSGVNTYTLNVDGTLTNSNYNITTRNDGSWSVTPAALTVTANDGSKTYGQTYTYNGTEFTSSGLQNGETIGTTTMSSSGDVSTASVAGSKYDINISGATGGTFDINNYDVTYVKGKLTVNTAALTVTADDGSKTYGQTYTYNGTEFTSSGLQNGETIGTTTMSSSGDVSTASVAGSKYDIDISGATGGTFDINNYSVTYVKGKLTVNTADLTITADNGSKTYGQTYTYNGTEFTSSGLQNGETIGTTTMSSSGDVATANVNGSPYDINISGATGGTFDINNYNVTYEKGALTINKADITVTANGGTSVYGESPTNPGLSATGLQNGQDVSVLTGLSNSFGITNTSNVNTYTLNVDGTLTNTNYNITQRNDGSWSVTPAALTVTANDGSKTYGQTYTYNGTEFTSSGLQNGETIGTTTMSSSGDVSTASVAGSKYDINISGATGGTFDINNYDVTYVKGKLTVNTAALTVTADNGSKTYGQTYTYSGTEFTSNGLQNGETIGTTTMSSSGDVATANVNGSPYDINISGATGGTFDTSNYNITYVKGALTINKADITVTANGGTSVYGDSPSNPGLSATGLQNGQDVSVLTGLSNSFGITSTTNVNLAGYTLNVDGTLTNNNYNITQRNDGNWTVTPASLTVTANDGSKTYGQTYTYNGTEFTSNGLKNGETIGSTTMNSTGDVATANVAGSPYDINISSAVGGTFNINNYAVTYVKGKLTINAADITVTANGGTSVYGESPSNPGLSATGLQNGQDVSVLTGLSNSFGITNNSNVNSYTLTVDGSLTNSNYHITTRNDGTWTVTPAALTITANNDSKTYDANAYTGGNGVTYDGFVNGQNQSVLGGTLGYGGDSQGAINAGTYTITPQGNTSNNYAITYVSGTLTVGKAGLTVTADDKSKTYGGIDPTLTYTVTGLLGSDTRDVVSGIDLSTVTGANATAGLHTITTTGGIAQNYDITDVNGTLTVDKASLTITADPQSKPFGTTFTFNGTEFTTSGLQYADTVTGAGLTSAGTPAVANSGTYPIDLTPNSLTGDGLSNYNITFVSAPFVVQPGIVGAPSIPGTLRAEYDQFVATSFEWGVYGFRRFYDLEVPGTITRETPPNSGGIASGSSLVHLTIGMDSVYHVDRFQTFRH